MSSLSPAGRSAAAHQNARASLSCFTLSDGRRCRSTRSGNHSHLCPYHAGKEAQSTAADKLSRDISYFLFGDYLTACDLSTSLGRLIPAVLRGDVKRGDVKPKPAHTVAYLAQTLAQTIHLAQHEYINAFSTEGWRSAVRDSVNQNSDYRKPSRPDELQETPSQSQPPHPQPQPNQPHVGAGLQPGSPVPPPASSQGAVATLQPVVAGLQSGSPTPTSAPPRTSASSESLTLSPVSTPPSPTPSPSVPNRVPSAIRFT